MFWNKKGKIENPALKRPWKFWVNKVIQGLVAIGFVLALLFAILHSCNVLNMGNFASLYFWALAFVPSIAKWLFERFAKYENWDIQLKKLLNSGAINEKTKIRTSYSHCIFYEKDGKYLLVRPSDRDMKYKFFSETYPITDKNEYEEIKDKFQALRDELFDRDYDDYRFLVPAKNIRKFYRAFCKKVNPKDTDLSSLQERFYEYTGTSKDTLGQLDLRYRKRTIFPVAYSKFSQRYEMLVVDSYELIATDEQKKMLDELNNPKLAFKTERDILHNGMDREAKKYDADIMDTCSTILFED